MTDTCSLCGIEIATGECRHAVITDTQVLMSRSEWDRLTDRLAAANEEGPIETISESTKRTLQHQADRIKQLLADMADVEASREEVARSAQGFAEAAAIQVQVADRLQARLFATETQRDKFGNELAQERSKPGGSFDQWARLQAAEAALEQIAEQQPKTMEMIEANGFIFDSIGREPGNWQHLAFSIYTDLCRVDSLARTARWDTEVCPSCKPGGTQNIHFDRTLCACGAMHYYCNECGCQTDPCDG